MSKMPATFKQRKSIYFDSFWIGTRDLVWCNANEIALDLSAGNDVFWCATDQYHVLHVMRAVCVPYPRAKF